MLSKSAFDFHCSQYGSQGFTILLNAACPDFIEQMSAIVENAHKENLIDGDESAHSWKEIAMDPALPLPKIFGSECYSSIIGGQPRKMAQWLNIFKSGEFIGGHVDAGGDLQLMIPIETPDRAQGGDIWVENERKLLPVAKGDILVFAAHRLQHGTTRILFGRRISFNCRIWLSTKPSKLK